MIGLHSQATLAAPLCCGRALIERFTSEPVEPPATGSAQDWVESVTSHLTATEACAVVEHLFGVLPLVNTFFENGEGEMAAVTSGLKLGALGLFTPTPEHGWGAAVMVAEPSGGALRLCGEVRIPSQAPEGSIVLLRQNDTDQRLAWLDHDTQGVERRGSRTGGPLRGTNSPCWLAVDGATIASALVSRPVTLAPGTELYRHLEMYASVWALVAVDCARRGVRALRRAVRTTRSPGQSAAVSASQLVAMGITEVEIETELTIAAAQRHITLAAPHPNRAAGIVLALSTARTLAAVAAQASELRDHLGVSLDASLADETAASLTAYLGGTLTLENELARALGLGHPSA